MLKKRHRQGTAARGGYSVEKEVAPPALEEFTMPLDRCSPEKELEAKWVCRGGEKGSQRGRDCCSPPPE